MSRPPPPVAELLIAGHVARDHIGTDTRLGGAAAFSARAAAALGVPTAVVTAAPEGFDLLAPLADDPLVRLVRLDAAQPTTFDLDYSGPVRRVRLLARAPDLRAEDVPEELREVPLAYLGPICGECGRSFLAGLGAERVIVGAQGWLRRFSDEGLVVPALAPAAEDPPPGLDVVVFSELDHPAAEAVALRFAARAPLVALTRGARGATLYVDGAPHEVPAVPAHEVDPTGAGDVFGLVLGLATHVGCPPLEAAHLAAAAAARVVEGPGLGRLPELAADPAWRAALGE